MRHLVAWPPPNFERTIPNLFYDFYSSKKTEDPLCRFSFVNASTHSSDLMRVSRASTESPSVSDSRIPLPLELFVRSVHDQLLLIAHATTQISSNVALYYYWEAIPRLFLSNIFHEVASLMELLGAEDFLTLLAPPFHRSSPSYTLLFSRSPPDRKPFTHTIPHSLSLPSLVSKVSLSGCVFTFL